jgi:hypothetical protein
MSSAQGRQSRAPVVVLFCALVCVFPLLEPRVAWSEAAAALRDDPGPVVVDDEPARIVLAHYLGREVFVGAPPPGAEEWRHAVLDAKGGERRVTVTDEPTGR